MRDIVEFQEIARVYPNILFNNAISSSFSFKSTKIINNLEPGRVSGANPTIIFSNGW